MVDQYALVHALTSMHTAVQGMLSLTSRMWLDELEAQPRCPVYKGGHKNAACALSIAVPRRVAETVSSNEDKLHRLFEAMLSLTWQAHGPTG